MFDLFKILVFLNTQLNIFSSKSLEKADRKRNRNQSDEEEYDPSIEKRKRKRATANDDSSLDEDEGGDLSDFSDGESGTKRQV